MRKHVKISDAKNNTCHDRALTGGDLAKSAFLAKIDAMITHYLQSFVLHILANMAGLALIDYVVDSFCVVADGSVTACPAEMQVQWYALVIGAVILAVVNAIIKPILKLVSLPFVFLSMGLFMFVINAVVLWLMVWVANTMQLSNVYFLVASDTIMTYLYAAIILGLFNLVTHWLTKVR